MATDFAIYLRRFLTDYLAGLRGYSTNTILSYRDTFKLLICYFRDQRSIPPEKLTLEQIDAPAITGFLNPAGETAPLPATSAGRPSTRFSSGCKHKTRPGWPAARTSSPSPPRNRTSPLWPI